MIEAGNDLTINASKASDGSISVGGGRDVTVIGSQLDAGNDLIVYADRDLNIESGQNAHRDASHKEKSGFGGLTGSLEAKGKTTVTQVGSSITAGNDAVLLSGTDTTIVASKITAANDAIIRAGLNDPEGDVSIYSASDSEQSYSVKEKSSFSFDLKNSVMGGIPDFQKNKEKYDLTDQSNVAALVSAGNDVSIGAEQDIVVVGSDVEAERHITLSAGREIHLLSGRELHQEHHKQSDTSWGLDTLTDNKGFASYSESGLKTEDALLTHRGSMLTAGSDIAINADSNIVIEAGKLSAGGNINIESDEGGIAFLTTKDAASHSEEGDGSTTVWQYQEGEGTSDETVKHTEIDAGGELTINAKQGIIVQYREGEEGESLKEALGKLAQSDPKLAWMSELQSRDDIDWQAVAEAHEQWDYESEGLTEVAALVIVVVVTIVTMGAGSAGAGAGMFAGGTTTTAGATVATAAGTVANVAVSSLASQAALSVANNKGDLGAVFDELGSWINGVRVIDLTIRSS